MDDPSKEKAVLDALRGWQGVNGEGHKERNSDSETFASGSSPASRRTDDSHLDAMMPTSSGYSTLPSTGTTSRSDKIVNPGEGVVYDAFIRVPAVSADVTVRDGVNAQEETGPNVHEMADPTIILPTPSGIMKVPSMEGLRGAYHSNHPYPDASPQRNQQAHINSQQSSGPSSNGVGQSLHAHFSAQKTSGHSDQSWWTSENRGEEEKADNDADADATRVRNVHVVRALSHPMTSVSEDDVNPQNQKITADSRDSRSHLFHSGRNDTSSTTTEKGKTGSETKNHAHPTDMHLQTTSSHVPWAASRTAAIKEKYKLIDSPITGIPGTKENPINHSTTGLGVDNDQESLPNQGGNERPGPASGEKAPETVTSAPNSPFLSGTYRSAHRSQNDLAHMVPLLARVLTTLDPFMSAAGMGAAALLGWTVGYWGWSYVWTLLMGVAVGVWVLGIRRKWGRALKWEMGRNETMLKLGQNVESVEWMNFFLAQLWPIIDPSLFVAAIDTLEDQFIAQAPSFITRIHIANFELGPRAPRISSMQVYPMASGEDAVLMDLTLSLHPSPQELASRSRLNTHILIEIHMGHPKLGSVTIPVLVQEAGFEAQVRLYLKLSSSPPFLKLAKFTLLNRPLLDFAVSPLKLGNIMNMPLLSNFIMSVIDTTVESMLVSPHVMALDLERMLMGDGALKKTRAIGVIKVVFRGAKGLRAADWGGTSDPFATLSWGTSPKLLARTRIIPRDRNPVWNETQYVTVTEDDVKNGMPLSVKVWDFDAISRNEVLGMFEVRTEEVVDGCGTVFDGWKTLLRKGGEPEKEKKTNGEHDEGLAKNGKLDLQLGFYPKVDTREVRKDAEKYRSGILAVQIHQAMDLLLRPKDRYGMYPSPYIAVYLNDQKLFQTRVKHHNPSPMYAVTNESFIRDWTSTTLRLVVKDARLHEHDPVIGVIMLDVHQLLEKQEDMFESSWHDMEGGIGFGRVRVSLAFRPVMMEEPRNMRGAAVGEVVMSDFRVQGLEKVLKHLNAEEAAKGGAPAPPAHLKLVCRSPLTEPTRVSTHLATEASFKPSWDTEFRMRVKSRYQTAVRFELHQKNLFGLRDKVLAIGKLFLQDLNDGDEQDVVLALKRWKRGKKSKALDEEDHFGSTQIGDVYSAQREHGKDVVQGERAVRQGTATDMEGRPVVEGAARAEGVDSDIDGDGDFDPDTRSVHSVDSAETDSISSFESDGDEVAGDNERRGSVAMSERRPSTAYSTDFESITSDQDVGTSQRRPSRTTDPVADGVTNDAGGQAHDAPTSLSSPAVRTHPTLTLKIRFSPGRTWISTPRVGEEQEMEYLEHSEAQEQLEADTSASLHPPPKASKLFNPLTSASVEATNRNHPTKHKKKRGTVSGKQSEDSRLPGNKLTRTLEWSKDTLVEGMKSTRLWKKNQRKSVTSLEM